MPQLGDYWSKITDYCSPTPPQPTQDGLAACLKKMTFSFVGMETQYTLGFEKCPNWSKTRDYYSPGSGSEPTQVGLTTIAGRRWLAEPAAADDICSGAICNSLRWKVPPFYSSDPFKWPALLTTSDIHLPPSSALHSQRYKVQALLKKENCSESKSDNRMLQCTGRLSNLN